MASGEAISHFGLGSEEKIIELSVQWPSGHIQIFKDLSANQFYTITEPGKEPQSLPKTEKKKLFSPLKSSLAGLKHKETLYDDYAVQPCFPKSIRN